MKFRNIMRVILVGGAFACMALSALPASAAGLDNCLMKLDNVVFDDATPADPPADPAPEPDAPAEPAPQ